MRTTTAQATGMRTLFLVAHLIALLFILSFNRGGVLVQGYPGTLYVPSFLARNQRKEAKTAHPFVYQRASIFTSSSSFTISSMTSMASNDDQEQQQNGQAVKSWEPQMAQLIYSLKKQQKQEQQSAPSSSLTETGPFLVALVGIPGSGKSTSSLLLSNLLQFQIEQNKEEEQSGLQTKTTAVTASALSTSSPSSGSSVLVMPMDGYHLPLSTLQSMPSSKELIYKRGSPETFDPISLLRDLKRIRGSDCGHVNESVVHIPGFDHAQGDPQPNAYTFRRDQHTFVICEGLYLLHEDDNSGKDADVDMDADADVPTGWNEDIRKQFDLTIFINADVDTCIERLKVRNKCIPGYTPEEIDIRCDVVDRANAMLVLKSKDRAMHIVDSVVA